MARPNRPYYVPGRRFWKFTLDGKAKYFCKGIPPDERPQRDGLPRRVWDEMDRIIREAEAASQTAVNTADPSLFWLVQMFLDWTEAEVEAARLERSKYTNRRLHMGIILDHFPDKDILARLVTPEMADELFERFGGTILPRTEELPAPYYVHEVGRSLRALFRWAARPVKGRNPSRLIPANPLEGYKFPPQPGAVRGYVEGGVVRRFLRWAWARARWAEVHRPVDPRTGREVIRPTDPITGRHYTKGAAGFRSSMARSLGLQRRFDRIFVLMLRFQRLTGCRPGEACGLRWDEIEPPCPTRREGQGEPTLRWEPTLIRVADERRKTRKQTTRKREIHLTEPVARLLRALERLPDRNSEYVFPHMRGTNAESRGFTDPLAGEPYPSGSAASQKVRLWRREAIAQGVAGVKDVGPQKLIAYANRHAFASEGSSLGFSDAQIAEQMGNTPEVMRKVYAHKVDKVAAETAREIARRRREIGRTNRPKRKATEEADGKEAG